MNYRLANIDQWVDLCDFILFMPFPPAVLITIDIFERAGEDLSRETARHGSVIRQTFKTQYLIFAFAHLRTHSCPIAYLFLLTQPHVSKDK